MSGITPSKKKLLTRGNSRPSITLYCNLSLNRLQPSNNKKKNSSKSEYCSSPARYNTEYTFQGETINTIRFELAAFSVASFLPHKIATVTRGTTRLSSSNCTVLPPLPSPPLSGRCRLRLWSLLLPLPNSSLSLPPHIANKQNKKPSYRCHIARGRG